MNSDAPRGDRTETTDTHEPGPEASREALGILDVLGSGSGFIRRRQAGYVPSKEDIYVGAKLVQKFGLRSGDELSGIVGRRPKN